MTGSAEMMTPYGPVASRRLGGPLGQSYWVIADRLGAGAHPSAGDPDGLAAIDVIVDLAGVHAAVYERLAVQSHPIADFGVPSAVEMVATLDTIDDAMDSGSAVYVHCLAGVGRTGTVVGCWLIRHRVCAPTEAVGLIARLRNRAGLPGVSSPETRQQAQFVEAWLPGA